MGVASIGLGFVVEVSSVEWGGVCKVSVKDERLGLLSCSVPQRTEVTTLFENHPS